MGRIKNNNLKQMNTIRKITALAIAGINARSTFDSDSALYAKCTIGERKNVADNIWGKVTFKQEVNYGSDSTTEWVNDEVLVKARFDNLDATTPYFLEIQDNNSVTCFDSDPMIWQELGYLDVRANGKGRMRDMNAEISLSLRQNEDSFYDFEFDTIYGKRLVLYANDTQVMGCC